MQNLYFILCEILWKAHRFFFFFFFRWTVNLAQSMYIKSNFWIKSTYFMFYVEVENLFEAFIKNQFSSNSRFLPPPQKK